MIKELLAYGYTAHVDGDVHPDGIWGYTIVNKTVTVNGKSQRNLHVFEIYIPGLYIQRLVKSYIENVDFKGPASYSSVSCLPTGQLLVNIGAAKNDGSGEIIWKVDLIDNVYPPYKVGVAAGTEAILIAIEYARNNPEQSSLRALIREVIKAGS